MQTVVTFKGDKREIIINFNLNVESGELDYNVNINPPIEKDSTFDLETHLADVLLGALLKPQSTKEDSSLESETEQIITE